MKEDVGLFDAAFFGFTAEVASVRLALVERPVSEEAYTFRPWIPNSESSSNQHTKR
jgi:hypothetical protein